MESSKIKILAIDDYQDNLTILKALIKDAFPEAITLTALNGTTGIELAAREDPDVILLDIVMPGMDGFAVCEKLKSTKILSDIPVIFVTAIKGDKESRIRALECGAEAFIAKPIDESELTAQIRAMVKIKTANTNKRTENVRLAALVSERTKELEETNNETLKLLDKLRVSELRFKQVSEEAMEWIWEVDKDGLYTYSSPVVESLLGYKPEEIIGKKHFYDFFAPDNKLYLKEVALKNFSKKESFKNPDNTNLHKDGHVVILESNGSPIMDNEGYFIGYRGVDSDITARKKSEEDLRKFSLAVEQSPVSILLTDTDGIIEYANAKALEITGYELAEMIGKNPRIFSSGEKPKKEYKNLWEAISSGKKWSGEFHNKKKSGELYWELASISAIINEKGGITHYLAVKEDITERKQIMEDLIKAKDEAEESNRLKSAFLANLSHEIRTPMNSILGFAELLKESKLTGEEQQEYIRIMEKSGERMLNLINDIVIISKTELGQMDVSLSETNINEQIEYIYSLFKPAAEDKGIQLIITNSLPSKKSIIITDSEKMNVILSNLIKNAIKFSSRGNIEVGYKKTGKFLTFFVKDTGIGINPEQKQLIFERFRQGSESFTRQYEGAGLGLSIAKSYIEMLGGKIWVESEVKKGSTFYFTIPYNS